MAVRIGSGIRAIGLGETVFASGGGRFQQAKHGVVTGEDDGEGRKFCRFSTFRPTSLPP